MRKELGMAMRSLRRCAWSVAIVAALAFAAVSTRCKQPPPEVICEMVNPQTEEHVKLWKELWFKVPRDYDERRHVEQWRAEQIGKGFTVEVKR